MTKGTGADAQAPAVWALVNLPLQPDYPNGFSQRAYNLLRGVGAQQPLDIIGLHDASADWNQATFLAPDFPVCHLWYETLPPHPIFRKGLKGRLGMIQHFVFSKQSIMSYPRHIPNLKAHWAEHRPKLAIVYLRHLAHLSFDIPASVPCICVLEEKPVDWDTGFVPPNPKIAEWKRNRIGRREKAALLRLYGQITASKAHVVAISDKEKQWFSQFIPAERISVIPHSVDCLHFQPIESSPDQDIDIGIFGVLRDQRNYEAARELYAGMKAHTHNGDKDATWAFVGKGPHASLRALQSPTVHITGFVPDVRPYYARSKVVVVPAHKGSGVKTTVLQAWAMGRPVVATPHALIGLPVRPGENVLVGDTVEELNNHIAALLASPALRDHIGRAGRETVLRERNAPVIADQFAQLCAQVMAAEAH